MSPHCLICSGDLLRHVGQHGIYWRCIDCYQTFSDEVITQTSITKTSPLINQRQPSQPQQLLCRYVNTTSQIQLIRITNIPGFFLEQAVWPSQHLMFVAVPTARLEVYTHEQVTAIAEDTIPCEQLSIIKVRDPRRIEPRPKAIELQKKIISHA